LYLIDVDPLSIYVFTFTRIDSLTFGAIAAIFVFENKTINLKKVKGLFYCGLTTSILVLCFFGPRAEANAMIYTIGFTVFASTTALLTVILQDSTPFILRHLFLNKAFVFLGKYSYALYIFHPFLRQIVLKVAGQPTLLFGSQIPWQLFIIILTLVISILVSLCSWHLCEKWFLHLKHKFEESKTIPLLP
jgi:peptidoglycan/LPS O-acetylase OafA/YrhL